MKIAVLGINYYPEITGIGAYTAEMCEYLAAKGHTIDVFTGFPYYPFGEEFSGWYKECNLKPYSLFAKEKYNGVTIYRTGLYKPKKPNVFKRIFHEMSFFCTQCLRLLCINSRYDIIFCITPPLALGLNAYIFSKLKKAPFVVHIQDLQPDTAIELGMIKGKTLITLLHTIERFIYKKAKFISTIGEGMRERIIEKGFNPSKVILLYNWASLDKMDKISKTNNFSCAHGLNDKFVVLHAGNMGAKQDMVIILEAAEKLLNDTQIKLILVGRGAKRTSVEAFIKEHNLNNVILLSSQPKEIIKEIFSNCDCALITQSAKIKDVVMPSKLFGPAAAKKPVIIASSDDCDIARLARKRNFGLVIPAGNSDALVAAIYQLKADKHLAETLGGNAYAFVSEERKMENIIDNFEQVLLSNISH